MRIKDFVLENKQMIIDLIFNHLFTLTQNNQNYETVWKEYQTQVCDVLVQFLKHNGFSNIKVTTKKSTYPEFVVFDNDSKTAFDVKVSVDSQNPAFDIARLDTIINSRLEVYENEFEVVVKYNIKNGVVAVYLDETIRIIGFDKKSSGVKYRPYDGKIRPKTWDDFEKNISYFNSKEELKEAIKKSKIQRNKQLLSEWREEFSEQDFNKIIS